MLKLRDIHWHRPIAKRPGMLFAIGIIAPVFVVFAAFLIGRFVRWESTNDVLNYVLMISQVVGCVVSGWFLGMAVSSWILGETWREKYLAGQAYLEGDLVDRMMSEGNDRSPLFVGIGVLAMIGIYGCSVAVGGNYLSNYDRFAGPMTALRGEDPQVQVRGLEMFARDLEYDEKEILAIRDQIIEKLSSPNETVVARAAWAAGQLGVAASRDKLAELLNSESTDIKIAAAIALARLHMPGALERLQETFPSAGGDPTVEEAWLAGLGLTQSESVGDFVRERFDQLQPANLPAAYWAIGMSGDTCQEQFLIAEHEHAPNAEMRCVIGDALKRTSVVEDIETIKSWVKPGPDHWCLRQLIRGPAADMLGTRDAVILSAQESLREKHMDAVFNTAADGIIDWYDAILRDDGYPNTTREHAYFLMQTIRKTPSRSLRQALNCDDDGPRTQHMPVDVRTTVEPRAQPDTSDASEHKAHTDSANDEE